MQQQLLFQVQTVPHSTKDLATAESAENNNATGKGQRRERTVNTKHFLIKKSNLNEFVESEFTYLR